MSQGVDILCITAHPDDAEIGAGGTLLHHVANGRTVGLVDLTQGELGTRGTPVLRAQEAEAARKVLGALFREQLFLPDGFVHGDRESVMAVVRSIRRHRPRLVITNAVEDRHPDHGRASQLVSEACFLSGLHKLVSEENGVAQTEWRPGTVLHMVQDRYIMPHIVVDITAHWEQKLEALRCFRSQFHDPNSTEPVSPIAREDFLPYLEGRAREMGRHIMTTYGEGFTCERPAGVRDLFDLN